MFPKSIISVVIHCDINNIDTRGSDEISVGVVTITRSIFHRSPNIEIFVSGLLPRDIHWSTRRVKIDETNDYLRNYCKKFKKKKDFHASRPRLDFARQFSKHGTKDHLHLIENGNMKFSKSTIIETLQEVLLPQSSQSPSTYLSHYRTYYHHNHHNHHHHTCHNHHWSDRHLHLP